MFNLRVLGSLSALAVIAAAHASTYDAALDFSTTANPNGVWSYGYDTGSGFQFATFGPSGSISGWTKPSVSDFMGTYGTNPSYLIQHPGSGGQMDDLRFTALSAGSYLVSVSYGLDVSTTSNFSLNKNGSPLVSGTVSPTSPLTSYSSIVTLAANDTIDSLVGYGTNGNYYGDSTRVTFTVQSVPEPTSVAALGLGAIGLLRRRAKRA